MDALFQALKEERIRGAALDVLDEEPPREDHPIYQIDPDRLIVTPHTGGSKRRADYIPIKGVE